MTARRRPRGHVTAAARILGAATLAGGLVAVLPGCVPVAAVGAGTGIATAADPRTTGTVVEDQAIEVRAAVALEGRPELDGPSNVQVTAYNGALLLTGETPDEQTKQAIGDLMRNVEKVRTVHNELVLKAPDSLVSRSNDAVLTTRIITMLLADRAVRGQNFKIVSDKGVVYLMGLVSRAETEHAVERIRNMRGVNKVVVLVEYTG